MTRALRCLIAVGATACAALLSSPAASAVPAIDGYLVVSTGQIYTLTQLGTNVTQVTHVREDRFAIAPRWSPDGRNIAFDIVGDGVNDRMYTMAADGSGVRRIRADGPAWNDDVPAYFPDGERIVFARCHVDGTGCVIDAVGVDGTGLQTLTSPQFEVYDFNPTVSPDGTRIAFNRFNADGVHSQVWVMNADGTDQAPVTSPALEATSPNWSPDGTRLTFGTNCCRLGGNVYSISAHGSRPTQLTRTPYPNYSGAGAYAPSGREIAFLSDRDHPNKDGADLFVMRADGAHEVKVDTALTGIGSVDWGPSSIG
jgi:Tol biopolymer transport system component